MYVSVAILLVMFAIAAKHLNNSKSDEKFMVKNVTIDKFEIVLKIKSLKCEFAVGDNNLSS